jgi:hypothetical protein
MAPSPLLFGNQLLNTSSAAQTVTLTNTTSLPLVLRSGTSTNLGNANGPALGLTGANATNFAVSATTCTNGLTIPISGTCTISVTFTPSAPGSRTANLNVYAVGATTAFATDALSGTEVQAVVAFGGTTALTTGTANRNVKNVQTTITNSGNAPLVISSIAMVADAGQTNPGVFSVTNPGTQGTTACPIAGVGLAAGAQCQVTVTYTPPAAGALSTINGTLTLTDTGAATTTQTRAYTGN